MTYEPDSPQAWKRKNFDESLLAQLTPREKAEIETNRDLKKSVEQLVCDVHEATHGPHSILEATALAQKRIASLMGRIAQSNDDIAKQMLWLTWAIALMTLAVLIATVVISRKP